MPIAKRQPKKEPPAPARRLRSFDSAGLDLPTALEIEEGQAWKTAHDAPNDEEAYTRAVYLYFRLWREEGGPCTSRCSACGVRRYGRTRQQPCGHCGKVESEQ